MTITDGIPGWVSCPSFFEFAVERAPAQALFVEVGVLFGAGSQQIAKHIRDSGKNIELMMVDSFDQSKLGARALRHMSNVRSRVWSMFGESSFRKTFDYFARGRAHSSAPHTVLQQDSLAAAAMRDPQSCDLVFLDNTHTTEHVLKELVAWGRALKPGGLMCGKWAGVIDGVFTPHEEIIQALNTFYGPTSWTKMETAWYVG